VHIVIQTDPFLLFLHSCLRNILML
jgi:hypothetical protein